MEHGIACSTGGGTHHAFPSHGAGYCLLNDLAVTAAVLFKECQVKKVLIVDLDVHQVFCVYVFVYKLHLVYILKIIIFNLKSSSAPLQFSH